MIRIIKGSYGLRCGKGVKAIVAGSEPIELSVEKEKRLVRLGVAEYVATEGVEENQPIEEGTQTGDKIVDELPEYSEDMKLTELKEIAEAYGVDASSMRAKKDVIEAIEAAKEFPSLNAADSVE